MKNMKESFIPVEWVISSLYTVRPGDNVYRIARNFNTKIEWIACMNKLDQQMMIYPDQQLFIPFIPQGPMPMVQSRDSYELYF